MPENPNNLEIVSNFGRTLDRAQQSEVEPRKSERDRLVWYVGIAGYVLLNANESWHVLLGRDLGPNDLLGLSVPWTVAALLALLAHLATEEWFDRDSLQYHALRTEVDRLRSLGVERAIDPKEVADLIGSSKPHLAALKSKVERYGCWARWLRRAAFAVLCVAFTWGLVGPRLLRAHPESTTNPLTVEVAGKTIQIDRADWKPMANEFDWAVNFEQLKRDPRHEFARVVTVFRLPMSVDRRQGTKVSANEYVEIFTGLPELVTVLVRVDKGSYWVLSRETFRAPSAPDAEFHDPTLTEIISDRVIADSEHAQAHLALQPLIDSTRYLIQTRF
jgi:hypothetical protein